LALHRGHVPSLRLKLTLNPLALFNFARGMNISPLTSSHAIGPISIVVCSIRPDKTTPAFSLVIHILTLMDISTIKDCSTQALNPLLLVNLSLEIVRIRRLSEGKVWLLQQLLEVGFTQVYWPKLLPSLLYNLCHSLRWALEQLGDFLLGPSRMTSLRACEI
jgi:hypothetical protein